MRAILFLVLVAGCGCAASLLERRCHAGVCAEGATQPGIMCDDLWHWPYAQFVGRDDCSWRTEC